MLWSYSYSKSNSVHSMAKKMRITTKLFVLSLSYLYVECVVLFSCCWPVGCALGGVRQTVIQLIPFSTLAAAAQAMTLISLNSTYLPSLLGRKVRNENELSTEHRRHGEAGIVNCV